MEAMGECGAGMYFYLLLIYRSVIQNAINAILLYARAFRILHVTDKSQTSSCPFIPFSATPSYTIEDPTRAAASSPSSSSSS